MSQNEVELFKIAHEESHVAAVKLIRLASRTIPGAAKFAVEFQAGSLNRAVRADSAEALLENSESKDLIGFMERTALRVRKIIVCKEGGPELPRLELELPSAPGTPPTLRVAIAGVPEPRAFVEKVAVQARRDDAFREAFSEASRVSELDGAAAASIAAREGATNDLHAETSRLRELLTQVMREFTERVAEREKAAQAAADAMVAQARTIIEAERKLFAEERAKFTDEVASYDHAGRMHKRRTIEEAQRKAAEHERGALGGDLSLPVQAACLVTIAAAGYGAYYFGSMLATTSGTDAARWDHIAPFTASILVLSSTLIFYLRWLGAWVHELARVRENHRKFALDSNRAAWLAELVFEWKEGSEVHFPPEMLTAYSRTLFEPVAATEGKDFHPVSEALAAVTDFKRTRVRRKDRAGETEVEFERGDGRAG